MIVYISGKIEGIPNTQALRSIQLLISVFKDSMIESIPTLTVHGRPKGYPLLPDYLSQSSRCALIETYQSLRIKYASSIDYRSVINKALSVFPGFDVGARFCTPFKKQFGALFSPP